MKNYNWKGDGEAAAAAATKAAWIEAEKALNKQQPISGDVNFHSKVLAILPKAKKSKTNLLFLKINLSVYMYAREMCVQFFLNRISSFISCVCVFASLSIFPIVSFLSFLSFFVLDM